jgi:hypothetical protein
VVSVRKCGIPEINSYLAAENKNKIQKFRPEFGVIHDSDDWATNTKGTAAADGMMMMAAVFWKQIFIHNPEEVERITY